MILRFAAVTACAFAAAVVAGEASIKNVASLVAAAFAYVVLEISQHRAKKNAEGEKKALVEQVAQLGREAASLRAECQRRQAVIDEFQKEHDEREKKSLDDVIAKVGKIARGES